MSETWDDQYEELDRTSRGFASGRIARSLPLVNLPGRVASTAAVDWLRAGGRLGIRDAIAGATAEHLASSLGNLKGALLKLGQVLSYVDMSLVPIEFREVFQSTLQSLQDTANPMSFDRIRPIIEQELGRPVEKAFRNFSTRPFAAASIGQVHRAIGIDGRELAVKVQYPGVAVAIQSDLQNFDVLVDVLEFIPGFRRLAPRVDLTAVVDEVRDRMTEELDYLREASLQREFSDIYADHPFIRIPGVDPSVSSSRVLSTEYVRGHRWVEARLAGPRLRNCWAEGIFRFAIGSLHRFGLFNGDPHPGNYLFHTDGTVSFLDFGCVKRFDGPTVRALRRMQVGTIEDDVEAVRRACAELGLVDPDLPAASAEELLEWMRHNYEPLTAEQPFQYTAAFARETFGRQFDRRNPNSRLTRHLAVPRELVFLNRITLGLNSVLGELEAVGYWREILEEFWNEGSPATEMGEWERAWAEKRAARIASRKGSAHREDVVPPPGQPGL